jgi:hypothetical protein
MKIQVCSRCGHVNPPRAMYCHFDGLALGGEANGTVRLDSGSVLFLSPFVFPSGRTCRNFNELVLAAEEGWAESQELLHDGSLSGFLGAIGRSDLARLASQAGKEAASDRALDDFLGHLPSSVRIPPTLCVQPSEINLGRVGRTEKRTLTIRLVNEGMGILHGRIASEGAPWLMLGEAPGSADKLFEFRRELVIPVQLIGERLRAGSNDPEGRLVITSNGGDVTVIVQAEYPSQAFSEGSLAGAKTPRQLAEKAKAAPKEAACLFENGAVKRWYEANDWDYPVQGPEASGVGAIQQYFEALGLTTPPRVEISEVMVKLQGRPGAALEHTIKISTEENRAVFAHAVSEVQWLRIDRVAIKGKSAKITLRVPSIPFRPGETLLGRVQVRANGDQRFIVAVLLKVEGTRPPAPQVNGTPSPQDEDVVPTLDPSEVVPLGPAPRAPETLADTLPLPATPLIPVAPTPSPPARKEKVRQPAPPPPPAEPEVSAAEPESISESDEDEETAPLPIAPPTRSKAPAWPHLLLPGGVLFVLLLTLIHDALLADRDKIDGPPTPPPPLKLIETKPHLALRPHLGETSRPDAMIRPTMRFGLVLPDRIDPNDAGRLKRLTFDEWGRSNNTCLRVDGVEVLFGEPQGTWIDRYRPHRKEPETGREVDGFDAIWRYDALEVTQSVEIVAGRQSRLLDTCLVHYTLTNTNSNRNAAPMQVGIRFLLDAFIGSLDGRPYLLPGQSSLCDTKFSFDNVAAMPDFLEAMEGGDLRKPETIARLQLRFGHRLESPSRLLLGAWPSQELQRFGQPKALGEMTGWDVPLLPMRELQDRIRALGREGKIKPEVGVSVKPDSAVTLYWDEKPLAPGAKREVGFAYGLGQTSRDSVGKVSLSMGGRFVAGGEITLAAIVEKPQSGETLSLKLPEECSMLTGSVALQAVPAPPAGAGRSVVTWRMKAAVAGTYQLELRSSTGATLVQPVVVYPAHKDGEPGIFD